MTLMQATKNSFGIWPSRSRDRPDETFALFFWIGLSFSASLSAVLFPPGIWYFELTKPPWTPQAWLFGPIWTTLYFAMGCAAFMVWRHAKGPQRRHALRLFLVQLALNALWSPLFVGLQRPDLGLACTVALLIAVIATMIAFWRIHRLAGSLLFPYLASVVVATGFHWFVFQLNPL